MKSKLGPAAILPALCAVTLVSSSCATTLTPGGAAVKVYETDRPKGEPVSKLPEGCRMISATAPFRQQEQERVAVTDPYRAERNATAERSGNVLLVRSKTIIELKKTDCPVGDHSMDCQERNQSWYEVVLESYACDQPALVALAESAASQSSSSWWVFGKKKAAPTVAPAATSSAAAVPVAPVPPGSAPAPSPAVSSSSAAGLSTPELKAKIVALMQEGVGTDVIVAYVRSRRVAAPLSAEEIVDWKRSGIAEPVIEAAIAQPSVH